jgi:hypothetical protein
MMNTGRFLSDKFCISVCLLLVSGIAGCNAEGDLDISGNWKLLYITTSTVSKSASISGFASVSSDWDNDTTYESLNYDRYININSGVIKKYFKVVSAPSSDGSCALPAGTYKCPASDVTFNYDDGKGAEGSFIASYQDATTEKVTVQYMVNTMTLIFPDGSKWTYEKISDLSTAILAEMQSAVDKSSSAGTTCDFCKLIGTHFINGCY